MPAVDAITATVDDGLAATEEALWSATFNIANTLDGEDYTYSLTLTEQVDRPAFTGSVDFENLEDVEAITVTVDGVVYTATPEDEIFRDDDGNELEGGELGDDDVLTITRSEPFEITSATIQPVDEEPSDVSADNITNATANFDVFDLSFDVAAEHAGSIEGVVNDLIEQFNAEDIPFEASANEDGQLVITSTLEDVNYTVDPIGVAVTEPAEIVG